MMMRNVTSALVAALALGSAVAFSGEKLEKPVFIYSYGATGTLGDTRATNDSTSKISCRIDATLQTAVLQCFATDENGNSSSCVTTNVRILEAARKISGDSQITFQHDANGQCMLLNVTNGSQYRPKNVLMK